MRLSGMPRPEKMGVFAGAAAGGAFLGALAASELVLLLTGGILAGLLAYTFIALALLAGIHRKRVPAIVAALSPAVLTAGDSAELRVKAPVKMFELPGCLVRYRLKLGAASGRSIDQVFPLKLFSGAPCPVPAAYRGAYYGAQDEIVFFDFFGFWRASIPLPQGEA
ncbi:MAG: hypothetical protein LBD20_00605, partial [Spirochaetaceae bacterium]|nr:hypothetical protein [Spirochaetaceae bacterium]